MADYDGHHFDDTPGTDRIARRRIDAIYRVESPRILRMLRGKLRGADDAPDLLQEAFARLAQSKRGSSLRNPEAYLQRIIRNLLVNRHRAAARRPIHLPIAPDMEFPVPPDQSHGLEVNQLRAQYRAIVGTLPPRTREVFLLHRAEEVAISDIAMRLGISSRTVEWHISKALSRIAEGLER